ncbi:MAG: zinc ribbon domain-containing protein [Anaerosomatales bacterium]|nr:zinc ribbon domain-containing protein [Anaerosomatales bacterium]
MSQQQCPACGSYVQPGSQFCTNCGAAMQAGTGAPPPPPPGGQVPAPGYYQQPTAPQPGYQQQPPYPPAGFQQPMPPQEPPRKRKTLLIVVLVALALLLCCGAAVAAVLIFGDGDGGGSSGEYPAWELSANQRRVVAEFGYPQTFNVYYGTDPVADTPAENGELPMHRFEVWDYYALGSRFMFKDGAAVGTSDAPALPAGTEFPMLKPEEFSLGMSLQETADAIGALPTEGADIAPEILEGLEVYIFEGQVTASFDQGRLVGVETVPVAPEGSVQ